MKFASTRQARTQNDLLRRRCALALSKHRQRARAVGILQLPYVLDDLLKLAAAAKTCCYCNTPLGWTTLQFDHRQPTSRPGGRFDLSNLCCCCSRCNSMKGMLDAAEFALLRTFLATLHPAAAEDLARRLLAGSKIYRGN